MNEEILENLKVVKRNGKKVPFDSTKVAMAIKKGFDGVPRTEEDETGYDAKDVQKIYQSVIKKIKPAALIVIDALASLETSRLGTTIQICNTGISPGSGVGNRRKEISSKTLGIPVIAIGVPTVISAFTVAKNLLDDLSYSIDISDAEKYKEYIVASREADLITKRAARLISLGVNLALQPTVSAQDMAILVT